MKRILETLLIVLALGLCGLVGAQWFREQRLLDRVKILEDDSAHKDTKIQSLTSANAVFGDQVAALLTKTGDLESTNRDLLTKFGETSRKLKTAETNIERLTNSVSQLREAVVDRNNTISELNTKLKDVVMERNEIVKKSNEVTGRHNEVVKKYNDLVEAYEKLNAAYTALRTNNPATK